jgi:BirA family transcriptional regulator, biotin operon repressor / biotin---[acetyl-CoA-carboxylase] ligase
MLHGHELLRILADGRFHSGERIGQQLGISRAGVWKRLRALKRQGFDVHSVRGRGHRLAAPVELLSAAAIRAALPPDAGARIADIEVHHEIDSTNGMLLARSAALPSGMACLAEAQRSGRGRRGHPWFSPCARNLYLSLLWRFPSGPDTLGGLSLAIGLAVLEALEAVGVTGAGIKWPNDIVWREAKLAGVLIEMTGESGGTACVVIGVGVNVDMPRALALDLIDQPWTDVRTVLGAPLSRNRLAAAVLEKLAEMLARFESGGFAPLLDAWRARDVLAGRPVRVTNGGVEHDGIARGVDDGGVLLLEQDGMIRRCHAGEVRVRAVPGAVPNGAPA